MLSSVASSAGPPLTPVLPAVPLNPPGVTSVQPAVVPWVGAFSAPPSPGHRLLWPAPTMSVSSAPTVPVLALPLGPQVAPVDAPGAAPELGPVDPLASFRKFTTACVVPESSAR